MEEWTKVEANHVHQQLQNLIELTKEIQVGPDKTTIRLQESCSL